jgi:hypothetical protein
MLFEYAIIDLNLLKHYFEMNDVKLVCVNKFL